MSSVENRSGKTYWRSLEALSASPEYQALVEKEFPHFGDGSITASTRRQFLRVMGASLALAGLTSCRWPEEKVVPFANRPAGRKPGIPQYFATARESRWPAASGPGSSPSASSSRSGSWPRPRSTSTRA